MDKSRKCFLLYLAVLLSLLVLAMPTVIQASPDVNCVWPDGKNLAKHFFPESKNLKYERTISFQQVGRTCEYGYMEISQIVIGSGLTTPAHYLILLRQVFGDSYIVGDSPIPVSEYYLFNSAITVDSASGLVSFYFFHSIYEKNGIRSTLSNTGSAGNYPIHWEDVPKQAQMDLKASNLCNEFECENL